MIIAGSSLRVSISIGEDIGSGGTVTIGYQNPTLGGVWPGTVSDAEAGTAYYDISPAELSVTGLWTVWATYTLLDGRVLKTPARQFTVYAEGTVQR